MPVCIFNTLARSSCQPLLSQLLQQTTPLYTSPCCLSCLSCCRLQPLCPPIPTFNPQLPITVAIFHGNLAAIPPSFVPLLPPPIAIVLPAGHCHHCLPLQSCCRPPPPAAAHTPPLLHAVAPTLLPLHTVARTPHPLPAFARTLAACRPSRSCPWPPPLAAAHTHAACCRTHAATAAYCYTHACTLLPPLLLSPLPPPPLLVPRALIAKKKVSINWCD